MSQEISFLIIVPTYNSFEKLERFKKSLLCQTFKNWRVIFVDADSVKEHKEWLDLCVSLDKRFTAYQEPKENKGIFPSMTFGSQFANQNDWVMFFGSDDWFASKNSLSKIAKTIAHSLNEVNQKLIISGTQFINKKNDNVLRINSVPNLRFTSNKELAKFTFLGYVPAHQSLCFSQELLEKLMPYSNQYNLAADSDLIFKMFSLEEFKIIFIKEILINIQAGGISSIFLRKRLKELIFIYFNYFKFLFLIPFSLRYFKKIFSRLKTINQQER